jgi:hypothetical protein
VEIRVGARIRQLVTGSDGKHEGKSWDVSNPRSPDRRLCDKWITIMLAADLYQPLRPLGDGITRVVAVGKMPCNKNQRFWGWYSMISLKGAGRSQSPMFFRRFIGASALLTTGLGAPSLAAAELRCPPRLPGPHPGFERVGPIPTAHWLLRHMKLYEGAPGEELKSAPAQLAPDNSSERPGGYTAVWRFGGIRDLLIVCTYDGSGTYYRAQPSPVPASCTVRDDKGLIQAWCE